MASQYWFIVFNFGVPLIWVGILILAIWSAYQASVNRRDARGLGYRAWAWALWILLFLFTLFAVPGQVLLDIAHS
jgi:hypothetical protein